MPQTPPPPLQPILPQLPQKLPQADLRNAVRAGLPEIIALRHDLHAHPELAFEEERTARAVANLLSAHQISFLSGVGGTHGMIATITGSARANPTSGQRTLALRGDMDALPIQEENEVPYKSQRPGVMHACGHDGHTANLAGVALTLNALRPHFAGTVKLIFQPAEEIVQGAKRMVAAGAVDDVDAIIMLHGWPSLPAGKVGLRTGPAMASSDSFSLTVRGKGGHAAYPHTTVDPILTGAQIVMALQTLVSREISPTAPVVVSVSQFHAGTAKNIIPETAELAGTVRTLNAELRQQMPEKLERIIGGICAALRAEFEFNFHFGTPVTVNDAAVTDLIRTVGSELLGEEQLVELSEPTMGAEDFAYYLEKVPGAMFRLGTGCPASLHTPRYDYGDAPLETGMLLMSGAALRFLGGKAEGE